MQSFPQYDEKLAESLRSVLVESSAGGYSVKYNGLVKTLCENVATRAKCYYALSSCVTYINATGHAKLIDHLFSFNFFTSNEDIIMCYCELMKHLNAAHGVVFLSRTFSHIASFFRPVQGDGEEAVTRIEGYVQDLLRDLLKIPGAVFKLTTELSSRFPHFLEPLVQHVPYVRNLLIIMKNNVILTENILYLLIDRMIQVDSAIPLEDAQTNDLDNDEEEEQFQMDNSINTLQSQKKIFADKMDTLLDMLMQFISKCDQEHQDLIFHVMLQIFDQIILLTYRSKYTQFILFYMCGLKEAYLHEFLDLLLKKFEKTENSYSNSQSITSILQPTTAYIGSVVGRITNVSTDTILKVLERLFWVMLKYVNLQGNDFPDADKHGLFYSVCQSYIYILCFKIKIVQQSRACINCLDNILKCNLNPLKFIQPDILAEFSNFCRHLVILDFLDPLIESNQNLQLSSHASYGGENKIDNFFPFDPFLLKKSSKHFQANYQEWESINCDEEQNDSSHYEALGRSFDSQSQSYDYSATSPCISFEIESNFRHQQQLASSLDMEFISNSPSRRDYNPFINVNNINEFL